jgi:hypothetical protein
MNAELKLELSPHQQEIVLRGLRFVRSAVALEMIDPTPETEASRRQQYAEIDELKELLEGRGARSAANV